MSLDFNRNETTRSSEPVPPMTFHSGTSSSPRASEVTNQVHDGQSAEVEKESFAEVALRLSGASEDEAKRTGVLDTADDQVEALFANRYRTTNSPIHRAIWDRKIETEQFASTPLMMRDRVAKVIQDSLAVVRRSRDANTLLNDQGKIDDAVFAELAASGYWGLLVDTAYGGSGATMREFTSMITQMATIDPTVAGLASVHGCIGAVDPIRSFGSDDQKRRFLRKLANGTRLSAFALTEPGAGSDLTALRTTAVRDGDAFLVNGEKLFITNAIPGRTIGLVCRIEGKPSVLIVDLPEQETDQFRLNRYGLYALRRVHNNGLVFRDFRVPAENLLQPARGDGLTIAYHGLNLGRVALCANAAGAMRWMLREIMPWAAYRETYGQAIEKRELVRRRMGRLAGLIVACDALTAWCSSLLDEGYRGEMECIIAKIFGSEAQKEAAIELFMKTHGGRSFLHGHAFGDNVHEFLAPCIYEGEGEMLGMAFFKSLVKHHGQQYFEQIGRILHERGIKQPNMMNPAHVWPLRKPIFEYMRWYATQGLWGSRWTKLPSMPAHFVKHAKFAQRLLTRSGRQISDVMRTHQLQLADRQCRMSALSSTIQDAVVMLVTSLYGGQSSDEITRQAADTACRELRCRLTGVRASDRDYRQVTSLGAAIAEQQWSELDHVKSGGIMMPYR
jgi:alkylation response protein AidB-like acyl-CoA dehydrogenase